MVFFNCNNCSEALKGNKLEGHKYKCNFSTVTCVDCLKDFDLATSKLHKTCMTENQRYGGKNYVEKEMKGQKKQEEWINKLKDTIKISKFGKDIEGHLNRILNYENIPRKKPKFLNFVKASITKDERIGEKLWSIIEQAIKPQQSTSLENGNKSIKKEGNELEKENNELANINKQNCDLVDKAKDLNHHNKKEENSLKRQLADEDDENDKVKKLRMSVESQEDDLNEGTIADRSINQVIENLIERSKETQTVINPTKLTKKVLKRKENREMKLKKFKKLIRKLGPYTEFKELPINEFYDKFIKKLSTKDCFTIDKEMISYKG